MVDLNTLNLNSIFNLLSVLSANPYEGKQINLLSSDVAADRRAHSISELLNIKAMEFILDEENGLSC